MPNETTRLKAVLVGLQLPDVTLAEHEASLSELGRLANTLGYDVVATLSQRRSGALTGTVIGEGKLKELALLTGGSGKVSSFSGKSKNTPEDEDEASAAARFASANAAAAGIRDDETPRAEIVIFDDELSPTQLRNLQQATGVEVLDRTGLIIEIFHRHAKSREARIQVDIARLRYLAPRLRMARVGQDRQGGGIGSKGVGETAHELDKRRIRDRIAELRQELAEIQVGQNERRQRRKDQLKVALVGYTNAGKSSLMRALTGSQVLVEDKLFATLDTTVRAMQPEVLPRILISDTVGFIKKLPHDLVASFRSTLDEAADAALLLYVVDASDAGFRSQLAVTRTVLGELDLSAGESLVILNKVDCLTPSETAALLQEFPGAIALSTRQKDLVAHLRAEIITHFEKEMIETDLVVPYAHGKILGEIRSSMRVIKQIHEDEATIVTVRGFPELINAISRKLGNK